MRIDDVRPWVLAIAIPLALVLVSIPLLTALHAITYPAPTTEPQPVWTAELAQVDAALAGGDIGAAIRGWRNAYTAALGSRRWDAMLDVGDVYLRIGDRTRMRRVYEAKAREAYLIALFRARRESSLDGVLRSGQAFAGLGDREVVAHCIRIADALAKQRDDVASAERVRQWAERLSNRAVAVTAPELP